MTREERTRYVCRRLAERVREVAPAGLGRWDRAWEIVDGPSAAFLEALADWGAADMDATRAKLQAAADEVVRAWKLAGEEWQRAGRPGKEIREEVSA